MKSSTFTVALRRARHEGLAMRRLAWPCDICLFVDLDDVVMGRNGTAAIDVSWARADDLLAKDWVTYKRGSR